MTDFLLKYNAIFERAFDSWVTPQKDSNPYHHAISHSLGSCHAALSFIKCIAPPQSWLGKLVSVAATEQCKGCQWNKTDWSVLLHTESLLLIWHEYQKKRLCFIHFHSSKSRLTFTPKLKSIISYVFCHLLVESRMAKSISIHHHLWWL